MYVNTIMVMWRVSVLEPHLGIPKGHFHGHIFLNWFTRFRSGNLDLKDLECSCSPVVVDEQMEILIKYNLGDTTRNITEIRNVSLMSTVMPCYSKSDIPAPVREPSSASYRRISRKQTVVVGST